MEARRGSPPSRAARPRGGPPSTEVRRSASGDGELGDKDRSLSVFFFFSQTGRGCGGPIGRAGREENGGRRERPTADAGPWAMGVGPTR